MLTDCYEKGHTLNHATAKCVKCGETLYLAKIGAHYIAHTQAELDRLWRGVDREAARGMGEQK